MVMLTAKNGGKILNLIKMTNDEQINQIKNCVILAQRIGKRIEEYENVQCNDEKQLLFEEIEKRKVMLKMMVENLC
jgi:hypothetical protein